jgi:arginyl-tRNA synthetase
MNIFHDFEKRLANTIKALKKEGVLDKALEVKGLSVEPPRDTSHGDIATNAAMVLAKPAGMKPADLARLIAARLMATPDVEKVDVAGPGFINITLTRGYWPQVVRAAYKEGAKFGSSTMGRTQPVNVEYVSANPTGPMPWRGLRRCAGKSAGFCRLQSDA